MCSSVAPARSGAAALFGARAPTKRLAQSGAAVRSGAAAHNNQWRLSTWRLRRSEEHTSELQSRGHLVCRLLLEKKTSESYSTSRALEMGTVRSYRCSTTRRVPQR